MGRRASRLRVHGHFAQERLERHAGFGLEVMDIATPAMSSALAGVTPMMSGWPTAKMFHRMSGTEVLHIGTGREMASGVLSWMKRMVHMTTGSTSEGIRPYA